MKKWWSLVLSLIVPIQVSGAFLLEDDYDAIFSDLKSNDRYAESVFLLYDIGILHGNDDGSFQANRFLNRAELSKVLVNALYFENLPEVEPCFEDLSAGAWYVKYVCQAKSLGYVQGYENGTLFKPTGYTTLAEGLSVLNQTFDWRVMKEEGSNWYFALLEEGKKRNVVDENLKYDDILTRGMFSEMLAKSIVNYDLKQSAFNGFEPYYQWAKENLNENKELSDFLDQFYDLEERHYERLSQDEEALLALFAIGENDELTLIEGVASDDYYLIWQSFADLFPKESRENLTEFAIFTDGLARTLAYVEQSSESISTWRISIDYRDSMFDGIDSPNFTLTLIHEFGHLLTLNADQVTPNEEVYSSVVENEEYWGLIEECLPQYFTGEGCAKENSYINQFYQNFWKDLELEFLNILAIESQKDYEDALNNFYIKYKNRFLNDYAATNPGEDIAESWTAFIIEEKPVRNSVADQKILFFYEYPELVEMRKELRNLLFQAR